MQPILLGNREREEMKKSLAPPDMIPVKPGVLLDVRTG